MTDFFLDHDVAGQIDLHVQLLGRTTHTAWQLGRENDPDWEHVVLAASRGWILLTRNERDFRLLHGAWLRWASLWRVRPVPTHSGILVLPQRLPRVYPAIAGAINALVTATPTVALANAIMRLESGPLTWTRL